MREQAARNRNRWLSFLRRPPAHSQSVENANRPRAASRRFISLAPGASLSSEDVLTYCRRKLPPFKAPKAVLFVDELPKNARGKIDRKALVDIWAMQAAPRQD